MKLLFSWMVLTCIFTSCVKETTENPCLKIVCSARSACQNGVCICNIGYGKDTLGACTIELRSVLLGNYEASDACSPSGTTYAVSITSVPNNPLRIKISNLFNSPLNSNNCPPDFIYADIVRYDSIGSIELVDTVRNCSGNYYEYMEGMNIAAISTTEGLQYLTYEFIDNNNNTHSCAINFIKQ